MLFQITASASEEDLRYQNQQPTTSLKRHFEETAFDFHLRKKWHNEKDSGSVPPFVPSPASQVFNINELAALVLEHHGFGDTVGVTQLRQLTRACCSVIDDHFDLERRFLRPVTRHRLLAWRDKWEAYPKKLYIWDSALPLKWHQEGRPQPRASPIQLIKFHPMLDAELVVEGNPFMQFMPQLNLSALPVVREKTVVKRWKATLPPNTFPSKRSGIRFRFQFVTTSILPQPLVGEHSRELQKTYATQPPIAHMKLVGYTRDNFGNYQPVIYPEIVREDGVTLGDLQRLVNVTVAEQPVESWRIVLRNTLIDDA